MGPNQEKSQVPKRTHRGGSETPRGRGRSWIQRGNKKTTMNLRILLERERILAMGMGKG